MKIGMQELLIVFIVALIVVGPDKLPIYARKFGEALREFRKFSSDATKDIRESIVEPLEEAQRPLREALEPITELEKEVRGDVKGIQKSFSDIGKPAKKEKEPAADSPKESRESDGLETAETDMAVTPSDDREALKAADKDEGMETVKADVLNLGTDSPKMEENAADSPQGPEEEMPEQVQVFAEQQAVSCAE